MKVAYLTMCYSPDHYLRRVVNVAWQNYPDSEKVHILAHQRVKKTGQFPSPIAHDYEHKIVEINVEGEWPELWCLKLWAGVAEAERQGCKAIIIMDEDDEYHPEWTNILVGYLKKGYDAVWTWINRDFKKGVIQTNRYDAPGGAMIVNMETAKKSIDIHRSLFPLGKRHEAATGAMDLTWCKIIGSLPNIKIEEFVLDKIYNRAYFRHGHANTTKRLYSDDIDSDFDYYQIRVKKDVPQKPATRDLKSMTMRNPKKPKRKRRRI